LPSLSHDDARYFAAPRIPAPKQASAPPCGSVFACVYECMCARVPLSLARSLDRSLSLSLVLSLSIYLGLSRARALSLVHLPNGYVGLGGWAEREGACVSGAPSASILLRATPRHTIRPPPSTARSLAPRRNLLTGFVCADGGKESREGRGRRKRVRNTRESGKTRLGRATCTCSLPWAPADVGLSLSLSLALSLCSPAIESWAPARWLGGGVLC
jgi:hypothetical protein